MVWNTPDSGIFKVAWVGRGNAARGCKKNCKQLQGFQMDNSTKIPSHKKIRKWRTKNEEDPGIPNSGIPSYELIIKKIYDSVLNLFAPIITHSKWLYASTFYFEIPPSISGTVRWDKHLIARRASAIFFISTKYFLNTDVGGGRAKFGNDKMGTKKLTQFPPIFQGFKDTKILSSPLAALPMEELS